MKLTRLASLLAASLACQTAARAELKLPAVFGDNMVLQQQMAVPVWGWSRPGASVTVKFAGQAKSTQADANGRWLVKLDRLKASFAPQTMAIVAREFLPAAGLSVTNLPSGVVHARKTMNGKEITGFENTLTRTFTNILVGEVWLASGQSNMEKPLGLKRGQKPVFNYEQELAAANYPQIRLFHIEKNLSATPLADVEKYQGWDLCSSNSLNAIPFSAAAYFFGREIHTNLNVPVGLIESDWGGTRIEPWTPPAGFERVPSLAALATPHLGAGKIPATTPTVLFNAMIAPITGYALRGAIWYQGESNLMGGTNNYDYRNYGDKMAALVGGWRALWHEGDFPFYFVQIAPFNYYSGHVRRVPSRESLPEFWAIQARAARRLKNSGSVVTTDLVDNLKDIHPRDKQTVGHRLALLALDKTYDREVVSEGPVFDEMRLAGDQAILEFDHVHGGLKSRDGQPLTWFEIAGPDGKFVPAGAKITGKDTVEVSSPNVKSPQAVRFAWDETAQPNLCNQAGLPAEPFRTDETGK